METRISRRQLLNAVGAAGGAAAVHAAATALGLLPTAARAGQPALRPAGGRPRHVVVIGAGIAGLTAAYELRKAGHRCTVLEASHRPGGRNLTLRRGDVVDELGARQTCGFDDHPDLYFNAGPARIPGGPRAPAALLPRTRRPPGGLRQREPQRLGAGRRRLRRAARPQPRVHDRRPRLPRRAPGEVGRPASPRRRPRRRRPRAAARVPAGVRRPRRGPRLPRLGPRRLRERRHDVARRQEARARVRRTARRPLLARVHALGRAGGPGRAHAAAGRGHGPHRRRLHAPRRRRGRAADGGARDPPGRDRRGGGVHRPPRRSPGGAGRLLPQQHAHPPRGGTAAQLPRALRAGVVGARTRTALQAGVPGEAPLLGRRAHLRRHLLDEPGHHPDLVPPRTASTATAASSWAPTPSRTTPAGGSPACRRRSASRRRWPRARGSTPTTAGSSGGASAWPGTA